MARTARRLMHDNYKSGNLEKSLQNGQRLIDSHAASKTPPTMERADDYYNYAYICAQMGDYHKAVDLYTKSYVAVRTLCGENYDYVARLTNLAVCYINTGSNDLAVGLFKKADELLSEIKSYGKNSDWINHDYRNNLYNLGNAYHTTEMYDLAVDTHEKQLSLFSVKDVMYADTLNCIGYTYEKREMHDIACAYFADALKIKKQICGEHSEEYIADLAHYAETLVLSDNHKQAMNVFSRAAGFVKKAYTESDKFYIHLVGRTADCAEVLGDYDKAFTLRKRVLKIIKSVVGESHLVYSEGLRRAAAVCKKMQDFDKALRYTLKALKITRTLLGENNAIYLKDVATACDFYMRLNMFDEAMTLLGKGAQPKADAPQ